MFKKISKYHDFSVWGFRIIKIRCLLFEDFFDTFDLNSVFFNTHLNIFCLFLYFFSTFHDHLSYICLITRLLFLFQIFCLLCHSDHALIFIFLFLFLLVILYISYILYMRWIFSNIFAFNIRFANIKHH